ncbi:MAG: hypothetical protein V2A70_00320 [Candidatus Omnitrophota bacterium]
MKILILISLLAACSGCAIFDNLDGAMALKDYSQEGDRLHAYVQSCDEKFARLLEQLESPDGLKRYQRKANIVNEFGEPIFCRDEAGHDKCLWRRCVRAGNGPRVYMFFDHDGQLQRWEKS